MTKWSDISGRDRAINMQREFAVTRQRLRLVEGEEETQIDDLLFLF